jgi:CelD/BcsL family acetyltransferase involved in cellulose biosynthesis
MELTRRCIIEPGAIDALQTDWNALLRVSVTGSPFCSHAWCVSWWKVFGAGWIPEIHVWECNGHVVGLLPLMRRKRHGVFREVRFLNGPEVAPEQLDVLVEGSARDVLRPALVSLLAEIRNGCDILTFRDLALDGLLANALYDALAEGETHAVVAPSPPQAGVTIEGAFDAYFAGRGTKVRRNFRHSCRAFQAEWGAAPRIIRPDTPEHASECFDRLLSLHKKSFDRRHEVDYFGSAEIRRFHHAVLSSADILDLVRFVEVRSASRVFGSVYSLIHRRRVYCYQKGFDPDVEKLSPGFVAIGTSIQMAFEEDCAYFDFLRGNESYKHRWSTATHQTLSLTQSMDTIPAAIWDASLGIVSGLRKLKRSVLRAVPQRVAGSAGRKGSRRGLSQSASTRLPSGE